ncbi:hypothetical protein PR202_gb24665 [Eleusine coracana subsp. coracana]|uniref:DUF1664 domain-containing protein n=1 Tax=Eleusine coracana subsp. coracana TaxID=191504 RepID=A0AAV5FLS6_ELECO|nr:hypothetical protein PR202_gb24665 [Eleusine coracana subsp. coracana]
MALVQAGMGLTRVVVLVGTGVAGSLVLRNGRLSEVLGELQVRRICWPRAAPLSHLEEILDKGSKGKGGGEGESSIDEALLSQVNFDTSSFGIANKAMDLAFYSSVGLVQTLVQWMTNTIRNLSMEVRQISSSRSVTVVSGGSGQTGLSGLIIPVATVGALGYGYMWWKGISFSDLMYVTKRNMANAVSSMTKHLEQVQSSLAAAKRHLTQRIEKLDDKLDQQKALSGQIRDDVTDARLKLENIGSEIRNIKDLVWGLDGKIDSMEAKQDFSCAGVMYLCQFIEQSGGKLPERLEGPKVTRKRFGGQKLIQGLQLAIESGNFDKSAIESLLDNTDSSDKISRSSSIKSVNQGKELESQSLSSASRVRPFDLLACGGIRRRRLKEASGAAARATVVVSAVTTVYRSRLVASDKDLLIDVTWSRSPDGSALSVVVHESATTTRRRASCTRRRAAARSRRSRPRAAERSRGCGRSCGSPSPPPPPS